MRTFILTALLAATSVSLADSLKEANTLLDKGDWQSASSMAAGLDSSDGYAVAAKASTLGASVSADGVKKGLLEKAQSYANQAIKLNAANANGYFELARADGRLAQFTGILQSLGLAKDIKAALGKAIELDPRYDEAYVALGLWNAELVAKGFMVAAATGANSGQVIPNFEKAIAIAPGVIAHRLEYANALLDLNKTSNRAAATVQLQKAVALTPQTYWDKQDQAAAQKRLNDLQ